jgi:hypothetical protein
MELRKVIAAQLNSREVDDENKKTETKRPLLVYKDAEDEDEDMQS